MTNVNIEKIKALVLDLNTSAYEISKRTGVPTATIYNIRHGKRKFENTTVGVILKLNKYFEKE